jgi:membrane protease subunit HflK
VNLQGVGAPEQVQPAFEDVVRAQQDRERFKNEGQAVRQRRRARGARHRRRASPRKRSGYRQSVISTAQGDASRFRAILAEYERAPQVTRERMYLDTMQQVLSATSKVIVDQKGGQNLLYLPLDRIMQMATQSQGSTVTVDASRSPQETASPPTVQEPITTRRDSLRSRDREAGR